MLVHITYKSGTSTSLPLQSIKGLFDLFRFSTLSQESKLVSLVSGPRVVTREGKKADQSSGDNTTYRIRYFRSVIANFLPCAAPPVALPRPKRRSKSRSSLLSRDNSVKRSPLSQREDGRHEPVFFGHQCRVRGCEFAASSLQHIKHHEQTSSHRGLRRKHEEDVNPFLSEEEIF